MTITTADHLPAPPAFRVRIAGTGSAAPGRRVSTAEVSARVVPPRDPERVAAGSGISWRRFAGPDESPAELGARALREALDAARLPADELRRVIFVSSGGGDLAFPATANLVTAALGLAGTCDCFDLNNACMGFLTALDLAARSIVTGCGPIGIVVAELASRVITPLDPRPYLVFGDGVAAAVVTPAEKEAGILGIALWNDGIAFGNVRLTNPTMSGRTETIRFTASHAQMGAEAVDAVRRSTAAVLAQAGMSMDDVDWVLPHQPNGALLAAMIEALAVPESRVIPIVGEVGSVGAASIPLSLDRLFRETEVRRGARILMVGVGGGISSGALLYRVGT